ncbi:MAG: tRNA (adenosine(37)-N6)-dimethylallyltransferase MiaA [Acidobacteria bacterium]|nr:tRNA (adenosine(37)-N6)-dimethylallyltransferase MiaA [Acidobacteriota bacterium]
MTVRPGKPLVISIVGPTASGKSALAIAVAERFGGEIVNCDSLQLYRDIHVGTGKPSAADLARIKHHLVGILELPEVYSAGDMQRQGREAIESIVRRGVPAVLVGGTGFYYRAVLFGLSNAPRRIPELRERLRAIVIRQGDRFLFRMLQRVDAASASRLMPADRVRLVRALEVYFATGIPFSEFKLGLDSWLRQFRWIGLGLSPDRKVLYDRINRRVEEMLRHGWVEEVSRLLQAGANPDWKAFDAIGYREVIGHIRGTLTLDNVLEQVRRTTQRYAKRQYTWFRKEPGIYWLHGFGEDPEVLREAVAKIHREMNEAC